MLRILNETPADLRAREALLDAAFGANRHEKTSSKLRHGNRPAKGLALAAKHGARLIGTLRLWPVETGYGRPALLLGPLAVDPACRSQGIGAKLMLKALAKAAMLGHKAVLLVGDEAYYQRFGFRRDLTDSLFMPGPVDRSRFLALELEPGALKGAAGMVAIASGTSRDRGHASIETVRAAA